MIMFGGVLSIIRFRRYLICEASGGKSTDHYVTSFYLDSISHIDYPDELMRTIPNDILIGNGARLVY